MPRLKDRVIIDTNLWISFLISKDYSKLDKILSDKLITLIYSQELLDEFIEVVRRAKFRKYFSSEDLQNILVEMNERADFIEVANTVNL